MDEYALSPLATWLLTSLILELHYEDHQTSYRHHRYLFRRSRLSSPSYIIICRAL